jgi:prolyl-tRNA synthetase
MPATGGETPGDTSILISPTGDYAATMEAAECAPRSGNFAGESIADLQKVSTPGLKTVTEVCQFLKLSSREILKTLVFVAQSPIAIRWVVAVVRGDHQVNIGKLGEAAAAMGVTSIRLADPRETAGKWSMGFVGPDAAMKLPDAVLIVDPDAAQGGVAWSAGGNEPDTHVIGFNWFRECGDRLADPVKVSIADIRNAVEGDMAWTLTGALHGGRVDLLAEIKHLSPSPDFTFDDAAGKARSFHYGVYRIDLLNTLLDIAGSSHDERGLAWPVLVAPCRVVIIPIQYEGEVRKAADGIVQQLDAAGIDAILDDRDLRAGAKFADADLVGFPVRVTIGSRTLQNGEAEIKVRCTQQAQQVALGEVAETVVELLKLP